MGVTAWMGEASAWKQRAREAEDVLRELHANAGSDGPGDPHFRHWAAVTILSYFAAQGESLTDDNERTS